ncbi:MAG: serine/threonine protein kinase [Deltaproteobacteria bacterium]|nr:serine/threonine protein kinase [Deltaproteobacteria bacterium]
MVSDPEAQIRHGTQIGRFVVVGQLGKGGMGVVYAAHDRELDRKVALKVMRSAGATPEERVRMMREGQAMARITHPNVITVYEVGVAEDLVFLAQELLDGGTLGEWLEKPRSQAEILVKFIKAGRGLAAAHAAGLVHRDFKPHNVLLGKDGRVRVADFGLARALGPDDEDMPAATRANMARARLEDAVSPMSPLTRTGAVMGTPMFMAPEQHEGQIADARSDQFAFSVALYHALYGEYPFAGKTAIALADAVIEGRLQKPPSNARVPARLRKILLRGLSTKREQRYPSMDDMLADLARPASRPLRNVAIVVGVGLGVAGAVVGGYALRTHDEVKEPKPIAVDPATLGDQRDVAWLSTAIERGQLDDAAEKYEMAAQLAQSAGAQPRASISHSAGALVLALRGKLPEARKHLAAADAAKGTDATAAAYLDMATAAVSLATGALDDAGVRSARCAKAFATISPELAATCDELAGNAAADAGNLAAARAAYSDGLAIAKPGEARALTLHLALASLDLDAQKVDDVVAAATSLQAEAASRDAVGPEAQAWTLLARAHLAQAATQKALEDLEHVKPDKIEPFRLSIEERIAHGEVLALLDQPDDGLAELDAARADAEKHGFPGLVLAARLARVEVRTATSAPDAAAEQKQLVRDARSAGYDRIADLAENVGQR